MTSELKIHLYKVASQHGSRPLDDVLNLINSIDLQNRMKHCSHQDIRLDEVQSPSKSKPYWLLDFGNLRFTSGPGRASRNTPTQSFSLQKGEGFAEETAVLYDAHHNAMLVQYNHYGPRVGTIQEYLSSFGSQDIYDLNIVLRGDAQARLKTKKIFTKLIMKVAPDKLSASYKQHNVALSTAIQRTHTDFGGDVVTFEIGIGRSNKNGLNLSKLMKSFLNLIGEQDAIKELKIAGKTSDEKAELINLLEHKLEESFTDLTLDSGLRIPRLDRWNALERAYRGWQAYI